MDSDVNQQPSSVHFLVSCVSWLPDVNWTSASPWILLNGRIKQQLFQQGYSQKRLHRFEEKSLFHPDPFSPPSQKLERRRRERRALRLEDSLASCLKEAFLAFFFFFTYYFTHFSFAFCFRILSFVKSSSTPRWASFKDSKCEESGSVWVHSADKKFPSRTPF